MLDIRKGDHLKVHIVTQNQ